MKELFGKCQYLDASHILTGKWSLYILYLLLDNTLRFNQMLRMMPENMTPTSLSNQLKALESQNLVIRTEYQEIPPRVEYSLTETARCLSTSISEIKQWGVNYVEAVRDIKWAEEVELSTEEMLETHIRDIIQLTNRMLTSRWTMTIMYSLEKEPLRFNEVYKKLKGRLTPTTLSSNLRFLESEGMIKRTIYDDMPVRVQYSQTLVGITFKNILNSIADWCAYYQNNVM